MQRSHTAEICAVLWALFFLQVACQALVGEIRSPGQDSRSLGVADGALRTALARHPPGALLSSAVRDKRRALLQSNVADIEGGEREDWLSEKLTVSKSGGSHLKKV